MRAHAVTLVEEVRDGLAVLDVRRDVLFCVFEALLLTEELHMDLDLASLLELLEKLPLFLVGLALHEAFELVVRRERVVRHRVAKATLTTVSRIVGRKRPDHDLLLFYISV